MQKHVTEKLAGEFKLEYYSDMGYPQDRCFLHAHPYHEFQLIGTGDITYTTSDFIERINGEKCFIFSRSYQLHNPYINQSVPHQRYQLSFLPELLAALSPECSQLLDTQLPRSGIWRIDDRTYVQMEAIAESLKSIYEKEPPSKNAVLEYRLLTAALLSLAGEIAFRTGSREALPATYIGGVVRYIQEHFGENITAERLSAEFFVSATKLNLDFKQQVGMTVRKFLTLTRVDAAKEQLRRGYSVGTVAEMCGYPGTSYFIKVFTQYTQITPLKYQQLTAKTKTDAL